MKAHVVSWSTYLTKDSYDILAIIKEPDGVTVSIFYDKDGKNGYHIGPANPKEYPELPDEIVKAAAEQVAESRNGWANVPLPEPEIPTLAPPEDEAESKRAQLEYELATNRI